MKISPKQLAIFQNLWKRDTGETLSRKEAIEQFHKLIACVKAGVTEIVGE